MLNRVGTTKRLATFLYDRFVSDKLNSLAARCCHNTHKLSLEGATRLRLL